ncbi:MAG: hypothetical protein GF330_03185, partial [Candidatus Eisenbacteria bacterium]|nr:hypothetical protein [Candidatus Eisenbacteria bacterium]
DTIFSSPFESQMSASLNRGVTAFAYRGYLGMSGFGTGDIYALQNGWKMPYAVNITCSTGSYAGGTARSEAWIRAGTAPDGVKGGIASIGTATSGTHTRYNNCMMYGVWRAIYWEDLFTFGESLTRGKYELYINYSVGDPGAYGTWVHLNNLMGDAAGEIWTAVPAAIGVAHPPQIPIGANSVHCEVRSGLDPVGGARVCLWDGGGTHSVAYTDADGMVDVPIAAYLPGEMQITVTKHDLHPYLTSVPVSAEDLYVGYLGHTIDDDDSGESNGNGDGQVNPNETLEIPVNARNFGTLPASDVRGTLRSDDPYVTIVDDSELFGDIDAGWNAWSEDDFDLVVDPATPNGHRIRLALDLESGPESWRSLFDLTVVAPAFCYDDHTPYGMGGVIDPGESGELSVAITNLGDAPAADVSAALLSGSGSVTVTDPAGIYGDIGIDETAENDADRYAISVDSEAIPGHLADMLLVVDFADGGRDSVPFVLEIGSVASTDPTGPDAYGYYAFDDTDTAYEQAPTYAWVEIAANHGGPGTDVGLDDFSPMGGDDSRTVDLPFPFTYYGETFDRVTICSNGWMAMGSTYLCNRRNWNIPAAGAPDYMIAPLWDNLYQSGTDRVFHWYDAANHRYIVQWSRMRNNAGGSAVNFEVILFDPAHYETPTGDGEILFQYDAFSNPDHVQHYCTIGIENGDQTDGVCYSYFNRYGGGAATVTSGRAILFTPIPNEPRGILSGDVRNASDGDAPIAEATVTVLELEEELTTDADGGYQAAIPVGTYTLVADHVSFAPDTVAGVVIAQSETTEIDFHLIDDRPPQITQTTNLPNTGDDQGPYSIQTNVTDYSTLEAVLLVYRLRGGNWVELPMTPLGNAFFSAQIPGQPYDTLVEYYVRAEDAAGLEGRDPPSAPEVLYDFWVLEPLLTADFESGSSDWQHYVVTGGFVDQWHLSSQRNHTPLGGWAWKFGAQGPGDYGDYGDGALELPAVELNGDPVTLSFWHWIAAEVEQEQPGYAYDGALLEISVDGGAWIQIAPFGGYPYRILHGGDPGPFPLDTPVYSGRRAWTQSRVTLSGIAGSARIRLRFGSDGSNGLEGWYVDDFQILPDGPSPSAVDGRQPRPARLALHAAAPNPYPASRAGVRLRFDLPQAGEVDLAIFDVAGRRIRRLVEARREAGVHIAIWDGRGADGRMAEGGVYFTVLRIGQERLARRLLVVR